MLIKEQSQRQLQVAQEIKKLIAAHIERGEIRNLQDIDVLVTITEVKTSPDLKYAFTYFITSDDEKNQEVSEALSLAAGYLRKYISRKTSLRYVPEIIFKLDPSFEAVGKIEKLLNDEKVKRDLLKS